MSGVLGSQLLDDSFTLEKKEDAVKDKKKENFFKVETSPKQLQMPVKFQMLRANTNLNEAPSNWMHDSSQWENYMQQASFPTDDLFSRHGKCLLTMHRCSRNCQILMSYFSYYWEAGCIIGPTTYTQIVFLPIGTWQQLSRIDIISITVNDEVIPFCQTAANLGFMIDLGKHPQATNQPGLSTGAVQETFNSERTLVWNFEDIRMLIGTDLPIFGGGTHPCVSLKLRDMKKPITVLTGLDYWLDNLMCNVPELAMCYHDDGIVQSYELLKTEDIPNFPEGKFSPNVIKDVAQNILSFLKSNATKEGHTYWLFKGLYYLYFVYVYKRVRRISGDPVYGVVVQGPVDGLATGTPLYSVAVQGTIDGRTTCRPRGWRFGTGNVGRSLEVVEELQRRMVDVAALQEIRWKGEGTRFVGAKGGRYKLWWKGDDGTGGVGVMVREELVEKVLEVRRRSNGVIVVVMVFGKVIVRVISGYAPQQSRKEEEKDGFYDDVSDEIGQAGLDEFVVLLGDLNGRVGRMQTDMKVYMGDGDMVYGMRKGVECWSWRMHITWWWGIPGLQGNQRD
ncbi:hypothetical protein HELRODRAFT_173203 [Helobdella robusta]|uniref:Uncharacterized protein n=1 Tax=Helobdella robusta TaxID=6412 RepID=T1F6K1_HELRO|nr:hypothetical protein HELRODRAFT_173203 [Helobdella robusta]ESO04115.1 hypothetical protein HELRODRAFT_173203 [Helobdella robusta]